MTTASAIMHHALSRLQLHPQVARDAAKPATIARLLDTLALWQVRARERHHLLELDERLLKDIGISPSEAMIEASKPFWRA